MNGTAVINVDLASANQEVRLSPTRASIVFWISDWPVGRISVEGDARARIFDATDLAKGVVETDVLVTAKAGLAREAIKTADTRRVTIIICTRDRPNELAQCLASLPGQTRPPDQVVIVDNASTDTRTREVATAAGFDYIREERPGLDIARNAGILAATGDIIAYTDDDVLLHPRWLERLTAAFDSDTIMAVTGLVLPAELETDAQRHFERFWSFGRGFRRIDFGHEYFEMDRTHGCPAWEIGAGASMAFRREVFDRVGLFDERLDVGAAGCSGDSEFWHRILANGGTCRYEPSAVAFHYHRREFEGLSRQIFAYMRGHAAALLVQYEQSGNLGNLRRALISLPLQYAGRYARRLLKGPTERDRLFLYEVRGFLSGILFYFRTPRPQRRLNNVRWCVSIRPRPQA